MSLTVALLEELQAEFDAWEQASDEDMTRLNAAEGLDWISPAVNGGVD